MQHHDNVKCWAECWNAVARAEEEVSDAWLASFWNKRSENYIRFTHRDDGRKRSTDVLDLIKEAGFSPKGSTVLDIGCGPGNLSLPLARAGARVTSLDISTGMLSHLTGTAQNEGLDITPVECSWWTADIDKLGFRNRFDLVIASMTPGIRDLECFLRMMACSKKYCYYSGFAQMTWDKAYYDISRTFLGVDFDSRLTSMLYPFMYLYTGGYEPNVRFIHNAWEEEEPWEEAAQRAADFLARGREFDTGVKEQIRAYYREHATDGIYRSFSDSYTGMMVWSVENGSP